MVEQPPKRIIVTREEKMSCEGDIQEQVKEDYGRILSTRHDLKISACRSTELFPASHRAVLAKIDDEILDQFYACGSPIPRPSRVAACSISAAVAGGRRCRG